MYNFVALNLSQNPEKMKSFKVKVTQLDLTFYAFSSKNVPSLSKFRSQKNVKAISFKRFKIKTVKTVFLPLWRVEILMFNCMDNKTSQSW